MAMKREQETMICAADPASLEGVPQEVKICHWDGYRA